MSVSDMAVVRALGWYLRRERGWDPGPAPNYAARREAVADGLLARRADGMLFLTPAGRTISLGEEEKRRVLKGTPWKRKVVTQCGARVEVLVMKRRAP